MKTSPRFLRGKRIAEAIMSFLAHETPALLSTVRWPDLQAILHKLRRTFPVRNPLLKNAAFVARTAARTKTAYAVNALALILIAVFSPQSFAQQAPTGEHYAGRASDTGYGTRGPQKSPCSFLPK